MKILVDGYNLLHVTGIVGDAGTGALERARWGLVRFLAASLASDERPSTTIVFDAAAAPPGLPREYDYEAICIRFAAGYPAADELLEELIQRHFTPRQLLVVSSDHRVQRAASRRRATAVDSDRWIDELTRRRDRDRRTAVTNDDKPLVGVTAHDLAAWVARFEEGVEPLFPSFKRTTPATSQPTVAAHSPPRTRGQAEFADESATVSASLAAPHLPADAAISAEIDQEARQLLDRIVHGR